MTDGGNGLIPCKYPATPEGFTESGASFAELQAAGFHEDTRDAEDGHADDPTLARIILNERFQVLRDPNGTIVATWDEGRWWTPEESAEFSRRAAQ
jgi:hypothetical protein